ncbi:diguanylate cyclase [Halomonas sp. DN3]|uniref:GGDEF domain-containing protein n=1 Tax=Halomonas sp. DN3 TaxID=2953657 RepID=UPI00209CC533|nr:sensor domain-containing diguanylate cyclase [Halomonas sp. DN3]USZ49071.1 sensor domain-containing diguanylate cyclase [Halomonas sp. DN3]
MLRLGTPLTLLSLALYIAGLSASLAGTTASTTLSTLVLGGLIGLAQLAWYRQRLGLSLTLVVAVLGALLIDVAGEIMPQSWLSLASFHPLAPLEAVGLPLAWQSPGLADSLLLACLALSLALRTRASLGTPLLHAIAALLWGTLAFQQASPEALPPLTPPAGPRALAGSGLLLLTQFLAVVTGWRHNLPSVLRALGPGLLIASATILLWCQQDNEANRQLFERAQREADRLSATMTGRIDDTLRAMHRFHLVWEIDQRLPSASMWHHEAQSFLHDFPELPLLALIDPSGRVQHLYPDDSFHQAYQGIRLLDGTLDRPWAKELQQSFHQRDAVSSDILPLPDGGWGIIHFLPIHTMDGGRLLGSVAMVFSLDAFAANLIPALADIPDAMTLTLKDGDSTLWRVPASATNSPWKLVSDVRLLSHTLSLELHPNRPLLKHLKLHYPSSTLCTGLIMALLLYLLLFSRHQQRQQHRQIADTNLELRREMRRRSRLQKNIEWLAGHDDLTGLANRRTFLASLPKDAGQNPLSLLLCDLDHFKRINDQQGHRAGDQALKRFAACAQKLLPQGGVLARYGGEEFVVYLPLGDIAWVHDWAEHLRREVQACGVQHQDGTPMTVCIGLITQTEGTVVPRDLLHRADMALYRAKRLGRNRVEIAEAAPVAETSEATEPNGLLHS